MRSTVDITRWEMVRHEDEATGLPGLVDSLRGGSERARRRVKWEGDGFLPWACRYMPTLCMRAMGFGQRGGPKRKRSLVAVLLVLGLLVLGLVANKHRRNALRRPVEDTGKHVT